MDFCQFCRCVSIVNRITIKKKKVIFIFLRWIIDITDRLTKLTKVREEHEIDENSRKR